MTEDTYTVYMPGIYKGATPGPRLGTFIENINATKVTHAVQGQHIGMLVRWDEVEKTFGSYDWSIPDEQYQHVEGGFPIWIQCKNTPAWARLYPELPCSPPLPEYYWDFATFVRNAVLRYKPFAVEIWNEPDAPQFYLDWPSSVNGCWDNGTQYGEFIQDIYPEIKRGTDVTVMSGALMMGTTSQFIFASDMLKVAAADVVSFHSYSDNVDNFDFPLIKADYLKKHTDRPLWLSETSYQTMFGSTAQFEEEQAKYLRQLYNNAMAHGIEFVNWYTLAFNGWRHTDLVDVTGRRKPAWYEFERLVKNG